MKKIDINELKKLQIEILSFVDDLCEKNNLRYSLCGGTLLGAVRHKGYIPWDDDIDIFMLRPEYEKLIQLINSLPNSKFRAMTCFTNKNFSKPFAKICNTETLIQEHYERPILEMGVNIDLFAEDGLPADKRKKEKYWNKMKIIKRFNSFVYQKIDEKASKPKQLLRIVMFNFFKLFPANFLSKKLNKIAMKHPCDESGTVANVVFGYHKKEEIPLSLFDEIIYYQFEDTKFKAIKNSDLYLKCIFNDYMTLPPHEERIAKHNFFAQWKE